MKFKQKKLDINGQQLFYKQAGSGNPVVLLHGWGVDSTTFEPVAEKLAADFTVYNVDFPGFGLSPAPKKVWSVYDYADCIVGFLQKLGLEKPILLGHSFGGRISIILGSQDIAGKIVLIDSAGILPKRGLCYYGKVYSYKLAKKIFSLPGLRRQRDKVIGKWQKKSGSSDYQQAEGVMREIFVKVVNEDLKPYLARITVPTLLVWGDLDLATPLTDAQVMEKLIPNSGLVVLRGAGHYSYLDKLGQFLLVMDSFLAQDKINDE
ncbi:MAG: alpha/beta fold hydrolase [Bacillota bacterium]|jgi:pimeloyl-ACP methyl ester carboxylesterase